MTSRRPRSAVAPPPLSRWHAVLLHPPHPMVDAITRQLQRLGMTVRLAWPALEPEDLRADVVLFDVDTGHDEQFPWTPGEAPMPLVALVGSEAAGRIAWAIGQGFHAHLLKPVGAAGVFSALLIAADAFALRRRSAERVARLQDRLVRRTAVVRAVLTLMEEGHDEEGALARLRALAMDAHVTLEDAAEALVAAHGRQPRGRRGDDDERQPGDRR